MQLYDKEGVKYLVEEEPLVEPEPDEGKLRRGVSGRSNDGLKPY
jgi:hypothetical protein